MASEMVVRVAKAIENQLIDADFGYPPRMPEQMARAAIEAMQPTREMMEAGAKSGSCLISSYRDTSDHVGEFGIAFKAMITEALKEPASSAVRREGE